MSSGEFTAFSILALGCCVTYQFLAEETLLNLSLLLIALVMVLTLISIFQIFSQMKSQNLPVKVLAIALSLNLIAPTTLFWVRLKEEFKNVSWNVDWRQALAQAYSLAVSQHHNSLYAGFDSGYHASPSLLASTFVAKFELSPDFVLFFFIPLLGSFSILNLNFALAKHLNIHPLAFYFTTNLILLIPFYRFDNLQSFTSELPSRYLLNWTLMLNSFFALAICASAATLCIKFSNQIHQTLILFFALFGLVSTKPQFIPYFSLMFILYRYLLFRNLSKQIQSQRVVGFAIEGVRITGITIFFLALSSMQTTLPTPRPELNLESIISVSDNQTMFSIVMYLLFAGSFSALLHRFELRYQSTLVSLVSLLYLSVFIVGQSLSFRIPDKQARNWAFGKEIRNDIFDQDLEQGFILLFIFLLISFSGVMGILLKKFENLYHCKVALVILVLTLSILKLESVTQVYKSPEKGPEYVDAGRLNHALKSQKQLGLILANDFTDPSDAYSRFGRGEYLASTGPYNYYLASKAPDAFMSRSFTQRVGFVHTFFSTPIGTFHREFIVKNKISHVLIVGRCIPIWLMEASDELNSFAFILIPSEEILLGTSKYIDFGNKGLLKKQVQRHGVAPCI